MLLKNVSVGKLSLVKRWKDAPDGTISILKRQARTLLAGMSCIQSESLDSPARYMCILEGDDVGALINEQAISNCPAVILDELVKIGIETIDLQMAHAVSPTPGDIFVVSSGQLAVAMPAYSTQGGPVVSLWLGLDEKTRGHVFIAEPVYRLGKLKLRMEKSLDEEMPA